MVDLETPQDGRLSPSGPRVVYSLNPPSRRAEHAVFSLWIAQIGKKHSARQLTPRLFNDRSPQRSTDGRAIALISDRAKHGECSTI